MRSDEHEVSWQRKSQVLRPDFVHGKLGLRLQNRPKSYQAKRVIAYNSDFEARIGVG